MYKRQLEAIALIRAGQEMLGNRPEADMPGFQACARDQWREEKYLARNKVEKHNRAAIRGGAKSYDKEPER